MKNTTDILRSLREQGIRVTPQRVAVLEAICAHPDHFTVDEVAAQVQAASPYTDISTVYRTLEFFTEHGVLNIIDLGAGRHEYELVDGQPHHHLVCRRCGGVTRVDHSLVEPLQTALLEQHGFATDRLHFAIYGVCRQCRA
jgi:Fur family transcriptional regulator, ferric uptake regulator